MKKKKKGITPISPYWTKFILKDELKCGLMVQRDVYYQEKQHYSGKTKFITSLFHGIP